MFRFNYKQDKSKPNQKKDQCNAVLSCFQGPTPIIDKFLNKEWTHVQTKRIGLLQLSE
jgi:hypothetical protein